MTNREPSSELLRLRDVRSWIPTLSREELEKWIAVGIVKVWKPTPTSQRFIYKSSLTKILNGDVVNGK